MCIYFIHWKSFIYFFFFFNDTATTEIYTLSLHDALPILKEAHQLLKQTAGIHYVGNVEGRDILAGQCKQGRIDVVVCDGFVGNVGLKFYESAGRMFMGMMPQSFPDLLGRPEAKPLFKFLDYSEP